MTVVIFLSSFCLNLLTLTLPEGVNYSTEIICAFGLHAEYEEEYIGPQQEPKRKIKNKFLFFYRQTVRYEKSQLGRECVEDCKDFIVLLNSIKYTSITNWYRY